MSVFKAAGGTTLVENQHEDIFPSSPMALVAVFTECLRGRFRGENALGSPYIWSPDSQPFEELNGQSKLYIESQYTQEPDARDRVPSLLVERGPTQLNNFTVGDRADIDLPTMTEAFLAWATVSVSVMCIAGERGTSATLADLVFMFFVASRNQIREAFSIHEIGRPVIENTQPYRQNSANVEIWTTPVTFYATIKFAWRNKPIAPVLKEIAANMSFGKQTAVIRSVDLKPRKEIA